MWCSWLGTLGALQLTQGPNQSSQQASYYLVRTISVCALCIWLLSGAASGLANDCDPIRILDNSISSAKEVILTDTFDVMKAGPNQIEMVREAEKRMTPMLCQAVTRLAYLDTDSSGEMGATNRTKPDLVTIVGTGIARENMLDLQGPNRKDAPKFRAGTIHSIIHESVHSATFLLEANNGLEKEFSITQLLSGDTDWSSEAVSMAREAVENNRLNGGFENEWTRVHQSFVEAGLANTYHGKGDPKMSDDQIMRMGVMSAYGGDEPMEDIAEMTAGILSTTAFAQEGVSELAEDLACRRMQAEPGPAIPDELAAVFTKVGLVQSLGLIDEVDYRECVGNLRVRADSNGFFSFEGGRQNKSYTQNVKGGIGKRNGQGPWIFTFEATGTIGVEDEGTKRARVMLNLELAPGNQDLNKVSFPRGLYRIGPNYSSNNKLIIWYNDGSGEVPAIEVFQADVLVARASGNLIEGSVFVKTFINHTELFKLPQTPKQDRLMTFRKAK